MCQRDEEACGEHDMTADVDVIPSRKMNEARGRLLKSDVHRFQSKCVAQVRVNGALFAKAGSEGSFAPVLHPARLARF
jgi:hypothetical protein